MLVNIDNNGDGIFDYSFYSDNELTNEEFDRAVQSEQPLDLLIYIIMIMSMIGVGALLVSRFYLWKKRKKNDIQESFL